MLICCIFSFHILSIGASYNEFLLENGIEVTKTKYVTTVKRDNVIQSTMSEASLKSLKNNLDKKSLTEHEKNVEILKALGYHEETIAGMTADDIDFMLEDAASFQIQVVYMKANEDGTTSIVKEEECLAAVEAQENGVAATSSSNDGWGNWTSSDGYLRMTISSVYIDPSSMNGQKGWYYFHTWYEWLIVPTYRLTDAMSIAVPDCSWDTLNAAGAYYSSMYYQATDTNGNSATFNATPKTTDDLTISPNTGVYYNWKMPENGSNTITYIQFYIRARGRITHPDQTIAVAAYISYSHTYPWISLNPSLEATFGWDLDGAVAGVYLTLTSGVGLRSNDYSYNILFEYSPD